MYNAIYEGLVHKGVLPRPTGGGATSTDMAMRRLDRFFADESQRSPIVLLVDEVYLVCEWMCAMCSVGSTVHATARRVVQIVRLVM